MSKTSKFDYINNALKLIPILAFFLLIINFVYNFGYFSAIGIKFINLLTIRDYYEGTAPSLILSILIYVSIFIVAFFSSNVEELFFYIKVTYLNYINFPIRLFRVKAIQLLDYRINRSEYTYSDKREIIWRNKEIESINQCINKNKKLMEKHNKFIFNLFVFTIIAPVVIIIINTFYISIILSIVLLIIFGIIIYVCAFSKKNIRIYLVSILCLMFIYCLGIRTYLIDYRDSNVLINNTSSNKNYKLIRPITRGIFVHDGQKIFFIDWDGKNIIEKI